MSAMRNLIKDRHGHHARAAKLRGSEAVGRIIEPKKPNETLSLKSFEEDLRRLNRFLKACQAGQVSCTFWTARARGNPS